LRTKQLFAWHRQASFARELGAATKTPPVPVEVANNFGDAGAARAAPELRQARRPEQRCAQTNTPAWLADILGRPAERKINRVDELLP
jgi:hypothetical protein